MNKKRHVKSTKKRKNVLRQRGSGNLYIVLIVALMIVLGGVVVGGTPNLNFLHDGKEVIAVSPAPENAKSNLQLQTFGFITPLPQPTQPPTLALCNAGGVNNEPEILVGYEPAPGQPVVPNGQVKVWVNDEGAPFIAPNEQVNLTNGQIITPGDRAALADDGYLWEPALYIAPSTAESGGTPHYPTLIKGQFSNNPPSRGAGIKGAPIDPVPVNSNLAQQYTAEFIWDVSSLGLSPGTYQAEFVIHDGDNDRGVGCTNLTIQ